MKATYRTRNGRMSIEVQGETVKDLFRSIHQVQEVFEAGERCGHCNSLDIQFRARTVDENEYFELHCLGCQAALHFGQHKNGRTLFVKRKDAQGKPLPHDGWQVYEKPAAAPKRSAGMPDF